MGDTVCGNLAKALSTARDRCKPAEKGSMNQYHKYAYASAEEIIIVANDAMRDTGLALVPISDRTKATETGTSLDRVWMLAHSSGESLTLSMDGWPVIPDKGRPLDKALAAALTTSLAYKLRDLLQIPRVAPDDDIAGRDDTGHVPQHHAPAKQPPPKPAPPKPTDEPASAEDQQLILQMLTIGQPKPMAKDGKTPITEASLCSYVSNDRTNVVGGLSQSEADKCITNLGGKVQAFATQLDAIEKAYTEAGLYGTLEEKEVAKRNMYHRVGRNDYMNALTWTNANHLLAVSLPKRPPTRENITEAANA